MLRGGSIRGDGGGAGFAEVGIAGRGFAVEGQAQDLADWLVRVLSGGHALAVADGHKQILAVGGEGDLATGLTALTARHLAPQHFEVFEAGVASGVQFGAGQALTAAVIARFDICDVDVLVRGVMRREKDAEHTALALPVDGRRVAQRRDLFSLGETNQMGPIFSVTNMRPSGRKAIRQGSSKVAVVVTLKGSVASGFCSPTLTWAQAVAARVRSTATLADLIMIILV